MNNWEGLLCVTGKALIPDKCFWYLLDFEYKNGQWKYLSQCNLPSSLYVHNVVGACTIIPCLEPLEACHMLGVHIALDGNVAVKLQYLQSVAREWQAKMTKSKLSQNDVMFSLYQVIYWKLVYLLLTTQFSLDQCNTIMSPILAQGLPAAGVVQSFLQVLAHGLIKYRGLDLPNLHTEQTIAQVQQV